jgi:hypothetical protein
MGAGKDTSHQSTDPGAAALFLLNAAMNAWIAPALAVTVRLGIADLLAAAPLRAADLAQRAGADLDSLRRLLRALCSIGVFALRGDDAFELTPISELLRADHPQALGALLDISLGGENQESWCDFERAVREGRCAFDVRHGMSWLDYYALHPDRRRVFGAAMTATTRAIEDSILQAHDFGEFEVVVDIGGSEASLVGRILERFTQARGIVFDLPATVEAGRVSWAHASFAPRLAAVGGDFFKEVPVGDLYLLKLILHDWPDADARRILETIRRAIPSHGRVAIIETILPDDLSPHPGWGLDITMMALLGGRERTRAEHENLLSQAGFAVTRLSALESSYSVLEARPIC